MTRKPKRRNRATPPCGPVDWEIVDGQVVPKTTPWVKAPDPLKWRPVGPSFGRIVYGPEGSGWWEYES